MMSLMINSKSALSTEVVTDKDSVKISIAVGSINLSVKKYEINLYTHTGKYEK